MRASQDLIDYLKRRENLRLRRYRDQAGKWTIGFGHLIKPHELKTLLSITTDQAEAMLLADVGPFAVYLDGVSRNFKTPLNQHQFDAVVSFAFNVGLRGLEQSTLLKRLRVGDFAGAAAQFDRWVHITVTDAAGKRVKQKSNGLVNRRRMDRAIFERGEYAGAAAAPPAPVPAAPVPAAPAAPAEPGPPWTVSMHVNVQFTHDVTLAENMDAATALVRSQVELFLNKARDEAKQAGVEMRCDYLVTH